MKKSLYEWLVDFGVVKFSTMSKSTKTEMDWLVDNRFENGL